MSTGFPLRDRDLFRLMIQNPTTLFAYWQLSDRKKALVQQHFRSRWSDLFPSIRLYDTTEISFDGSRAHAVLDFSINEANTMYFHGLHPARSYVADLGVKNEHRHFITLLRSNTLDMPRNQAGGAELSDPAGSTPTTLHSLFPIQYELFSAYSLYYPPDLGSDE